MDSIQTSTQLSEEEQSQFRRLFGRTPVGALPNSGMSSRSRQPETVADVFEVVESIVETLKASLVTEQEARDEMATTARDMEAAGRVLRRLLSAE